MKVIVLAGGFATRLWPITENRAKPLLLVDGRTILAHLLEPVIEAGFNPSDIYLGTNQKFLQDFEDELTTMGYGAVHVFCEDAHQDGQKLGALGAISAMIDHYELNDDLLILAGDNILTGFDPAQMRVESNEARLTVRDVPDLHAARKFGVVELDGETLKGFEEKPENPKSKTVSAGFLSLGKDLLPILQAFAAKEPDALGGIFPVLLEQGSKVTAYRTEGEWFDVGSFETYLEAHKTLQSEDFKSEANKMSAANTFAGKVYLGKDVEVRNCTVVDSIIYPGVTLRNCQISNCVIDQDCHLENLDLSYKVIRQNTKLIG